MFQLAWVILGIFPFTPRANRGFGIGVNQTQKQRVTTTNFYAQEMREGTWFLCLWFKLKEGTPNIRFKKKYCYAKFVNLLKINRSAFRSTNYVSVCLKSETKVGHGQGRKELIPLFWSRGFPIFFRGFPLLTLRAACSMK